MILWLITTTAYLSFFRWVGESTVAVKRQKSLFNSAHGLLDFFFFSFFNQTHADTFPNVTPVRKLTHYLMNWAQNYTIRQVVTCCCSRPERLNSHRIGSQTRESIKPHTHACACVCACACVGRSYPPPLSVTPRWNRSSYLLHSDTWTLPIDPRRLIRVDTGRRRSGLWASGSGGRCARVDTHICKCLPAPRSGECPRVCRDLTYINSEMRSSQRRGILEEVGSKAWLMRRVQYPLTYPHVANNGD